MKFKKILLFILIFFFCLLIKTNVNAFIVSDSGTEKFYLPDLPTDIDYYNHVIVFNNSINQVILFSFPKSDTLGYDKLTKRFTLFDDNKVIRPNSESDFLSIHGCQLTLSNDKYIGTGWKPYSHVSPSVTLSNFDNNNFINIYGDLYPCCGDVLIDSLIEGISWNDDFVLLKSGNEERILLVVPSVSYKNYCFTNYSVYFSYCPSYKLENYISLNSYYYDTTDLCFKFYKSSNTDSNFWPVQGLSQNILYCNKDILKNTDGSILYNNTKNLFNCLISYSSFPYILNGAEDLAKGEEDLIIMPR